MDKFKAFENLSIWNKKLFVGALICTPVFAVMLYLTGDITPPVSAVDYIGAGLALLISECRFCTPGSLLSAFSGSCVHYGYISWGRDNNVWAGN